MGNRKAPGVTVKADEKPLRNDHSVPIPDDVSHPTAEGAPITESLGKVEATPPTRSDRRRPVASVDEAGRDV